MDKQEAIKYLKKTGPFVGSMQNAAIQFAINALENDGWISVDEWLPKRPDSGEWLVDVIVGRKNRPTCQALFDGNSREFMFRDYGKMENVTHWQPLPQPPKEKHNG